MYPVIIIFYLALIGIILMVLLKRHEVKTGRATIVSRIGAGSDHFFAMVFTMIRRGIAAVNKKNMILITQWIAFHVLLRIRNVYVEAKHRALANPHSRKVIDAVRGRGHIGTGRSSLYLRRISEK